MHYYIFNIGEPNNDAWWTRHISMGMISAGYESAEGDRGDKILHEIQEGDWVIAYSNEHGAVGAGIVEEEGTYRLASDSALPPDFESTHRHLRSVKWIHWVASLNDAVRFPELQLGAPPRHTKTEMRDSVNALRIIGLLSVKATERMIEELRLPLNVVGDASDLSFPDRVLTTTFRIVRDTEKARRVKSIHRNECQICGHTIKLPNGVRYSEGHHIKPLGGKHNGPDDVSNILCVCPNHHAELDYGASPIELSRLLTSTLHLINPEYIEYHNKEIYGAKNGW